MGDIHWLHAILTIVGLLCLIAVWHERSRDRLSRRATFCVLALGPFSWAAQMWLLNHIDLANAELTKYLLYCTLIAVGCFFLVILANLTKRTNGRDIAQALIWGQLVYPLVLISFLPQGMMTFIALVH